MNLSASRDGSSLLDPGPHLHHASLPLHHQQQLTKNGRQILNHVKQNVKCECAAMDQYRFLVIFALGKTRPRKYNCYVRKTVILRAS